MELVAYLKYHWEEFYNLSERQVELKYTKKPIKEATKKGNYFPKKRFKCHLKKRVRHCNDAAPSQGTL